MSGAPRGAVDPSGSLASRASLSATASAAATLVAAALAILLLILQYAGRISLQTDEAAIALNLRSRSFGELLTRPLDYAQMAPPGWLAIEWGALRLLGPSEFSLRLVPFLASVAAVVLSARLARRVSAGVAPVLAVLWLATAWDFLFYGTQLKQYGSDVAVVLALVHLALTVVESDDAPSWRAGLLGGAAILCSLSGAVAASALGLVLAVDAVLRGGVRRALQLTPLLLPWGVAALAVSLWTLALAPDELQAYMTRFWAYTYPRWPLRPAAVMAWLWDTLRQAAFAPMSGGWQRHLPKLYGLLFVVGVALQARRNRRQLAVILAPLAIAVALAMAHRYPIGGRVTLFIIPGLLLFTAIGAEGIASLVRRLAPRVQLPAALGAFGVAAVLAFPAARTMGGNLPPVWGDNARPQVEALATAVRDGDDVFVHHSIAKPFRWYWALAPHADVPVRYGRCYSGDPRPYLSQVDSLRGRPRVWVATTDPSWNSYPMVAQYVAAVGPVLDSVVATDAPKAVASARQTVYLRTFADPAALASVQRDTVTVHPNIIVDWIAWTCFGSEARPLIHPSLWQ
ncbi:MAG: glycosyltransferase family 39 protein [Gemmatimonadaceae bacterium]|nr:glycosyltransferase family 39 protein [Gemmatimonadaceae bacterium]